ncbi:hypothetical protein PAE9249_04723 [Paenibacillus sp. CECT 9249]|nr:hypothetical protein PAE9249_04723 [Paenibacillus sp. CECT 9249]
MRLDFRRATAHMNGMTKFFNQGSLIEAERFLKPDEQVLHVEPVNLDRGPGVLVVTDKRVYSACQMMTTYELKQLPYREINFISVDSQKGSMRIETNHNKVLIEAINRNRSVIIQQMILERIS